jgi:hypothetical protein
VLQDFVTPERVPKLGKRFLEPEPEVVSESVMSGLGRFFGSRHPCIEVSPHYKGRLSALDIHSRLFRTEFLR